MKIFVTGATGFIGSNFINLAHSLGHTIVALRRSKFSRPRVNLVNNPYWIESSMDSLDTSIFREIDLVIHIYTSIDI